MSDKKDIQLTQPSDTGSSYTHSEDDEADSSSISDDINPELIINGKRKRVEPEIQLLALYQHNVSFT
jgi:hypothetical protein